MASHIVSKLTKEYARLLGRFEVIDREIEYVVGVEKILSEIDRIEREKRQMRARLDQIAAITTQLDLSWRRERVRPIYPRDRKAGVLSRIVYTILREAQMPLKTREIARLAAERLGVQPIQRELIRLENAVSNALKERVGKTIVIAAEKPIQWAVMPRAQVRSVARRVSQAVPEPREMAVPQQPIACHSSIQSNGVAETLHLSLSQTAETPA